jgi:hypothetical protein
VLVNVSFGVAFMLGLSVVSREFELVFFGCALGLLLLKGLWFFCIAEIVYSGRHGYRGKLVNHEGAMAVFAVMAVVSEAVVGLALGCRRSEESNSQEAEYQGIENKA